MSIIVKQLGLQPYLETWQAMQDFTNNRTAETDDEIWIVEHPPVFTQGLNGKAEHLLKTTNIPVVQTDRGGQITYHGPGQAVLYVLVDLKRAKLGVRALVSELENSIIEYLTDLGITSEARKDAPGVYVNGQKIASLGLKIRQQRSYHGLALNVDMDLSPFDKVNPCGLQGMQMTQIANLIDAKTKLDIRQIGDHLAQILSRRIATHNNSES